MIAMVDVKKDSQGRYVVSWTPKFGLDKGKKQKSLHFSRRDAINQAGAISSVMTKRKLRRKMK